MDRATAEFVIYMINEVANTTGKSKSQVYRAMSETGCIKNYHKCRKVPAFRHGDIRHVHRICVSN